MDFVQNMATSTAQASIVMLKVMFNYSNNVLHVNGNQKNVYLDTQCDACSG